MRAYKSYEPDGADERNRRGCQQGDARQHFESQPCNGNAEARGPSSPIVRGRQHPVAADADRQDQRKQRRAHRDFGPGGARKTAHHPEDDLLQLGLGGLVLNEGQKRVEGEEQRDPDKHEGLDGDAAHPREQVQDEGRCEREQERVRADQEFAREGNERRPLWRSPVRRRSSPPTRCRA